MINQPFSRNNFNMPPLNGNDKSGGDNEKLKEKNTFIISPQYLSFMQTRNNSADRKFLESLNKEIAKFVEDQHIEIFKNLMIKKELGKDAKELNILTADIEDAIKNIPLETKAIDLPEKLFGKILSYVPTESRQVIYIQRDKLPLSQLLKIIDHWTHNTTIGYHVSPNEIKNKIIESRGDEGVICYSDNIEHLFNDTNNGKYLYCFRISKKTNDALSYDGAPKFFKKFRASRLEAEDGIKIADEKDPGYGPMIMSKLGASFEKNYRGAGASVENFMKRYENDFSLN